MSVKAGFAEIEITPPIGTQKIGWKRRIIGERVLDPLFARAALLESGAGQIGWIQLDTLCVRARDVATIRRMIEKRCGFPGGNIMVAATHNHAGPAVASLGDSQRDEPYVESLIARVTAVFQQACERREEAEIGMGHTFEFDVSHNRRVVMRDGTVRTHGTFNDPEALYLEGPIDPELAVLAVRNRRGDLLGALVNFACHPTHHGGDGAFSAGYPGVLAGEMKRRGCPVLLFLNGASGNLHTSDPANQGADPSMEEVGRALADDVSRVLDGLEYRGEADLACTSAVLELPYRRLSDEEIRGTVRGAQRFIDPAIYEREIARLIERFKQQEAESAEIQAFRLDDFAFVAVPAEYFVELGLRVKEQAYPLRAHVVGYANGMVGYVPHKEAFARGGYETTFCGSSKLAPEAGDLIAQGALALMQKFSMQNQSRTDSASAT